MQETQETWVRSLDQEDPLEEGIATHSSILAQRIPCTEEPDRLQLMGPQRVGHDWVTKQQQISEIQGRTSCDKNSDSTEDTR